MYKILITDDSGTARMVIQRCLEMSGREDCTYLQAKNGQEALEIVRTQKIDLLITDMVMPEMDGKELLKAVVDDPAISHTQVVVITSLANPALENDLIKMGARMIVGKPVSPPKLQECIDEIFPSEEEEQ